LNVAETPLGEENEAVNVRKKGELHREKMGGESY